MANDLINNSDLQVQALINAANQQANNNQSDTSAADGEQAALNRKVELQLQIKQSALKSSLSQHEGFSHEQAQNFDKALKGGMGPDAQRWAANPDLQTKLTAAQKRLFLASFGDQGQQASTVAGAINRIAEVQNFTKAVPTSQSINELHAAVQESPRIEEPAKALLQTQFMQSPKSDTATKADFLRFGLQQMGKGGDLQAVKAAGDMLGVLSGNVPGRTQQKAMGMVRRDPSNTDGMKNVDRFVQQPTVQKLPMFARGSATEALVKADGSVNVAEGLEQVAQAMTKGEVSDPNAAEGAPPIPTPGAKKMSREMKARMFATIASGKPSELRGITDKALLALQSNAFPTRQGQVQRFMTSLQSRITKDDGSGKSIDPDQLVRQSKSGPLPKAPVLRSTHGLSDEEASLVRGQNRALVMRYYHQVMRSYSGVNDKLKGGEYLEDVRTLPNLRESDKLETDHLSPEDQKDLEPLLKEKGSQVQQRFGSLKVAQQKRMRELRGKRMPKAERMKKAAERRVTGQQPRYFNVSALRGQKAPTLPVPNQARAQSSQESQPSSRLPVPQRGLGQAAGQGRGMASAPNPQMRSPAQGRAMPNAGQSGGDLGEAMASRIVSQVDRSLPFEEQMAQMKQVISQTVQEHMNTAQAQVMSATQKAMASLMQTSAPVLPGPQRAQAKGPVNANAQGLELPESEPAETQGAGQMAQAPNQGTRSGRQAARGEAEFLKAPPPQTNAGLGPKSLGAVEGVGQERSQGLGNVFEAAAQQGEPQQNEQAPQSANQGGMQPQQPQAKQVAGAVVPQNTQIPGSGPQAPQPMGLSAAALAQAAAQGILPQAAGLVTPAPRGVGAVQTPGQPAAFTQHNAGPLQPGDGVRSTDGGQPVSRAGNAQSPQGAVGAGNGKDQLPQNAGPILGPKSLAAVEALGARPQNAAAQVAAYRAASDAGSRDAKGMPYKMVCPLSLQAMENPVKASDGQVYDRASITQFMAQNPNAKSPFTGAPLSGQLTPQEGLKQEIQAFVSQDPAVQASLSPNQKTAIQQASSQGTPSPQGTVRMVNSAQAPNAPVPQLVQEITGRQPQPPLPPAGPLAASNTGSNNPAMSVAAMAQAAAQGTLPQPGLGAPSPMGAFQAPGQQTGFGNNAVARSTDGGQPVSQPSAGQREQAVSAAGAGLAQAPAQNAGAIVGAKSFDAVEAISARPQGQTAANQVAAYRAATDMGSRDANGIPHSMLCPISLQVMENPVKASDGQVYDKASIAQWMASNQNPTSPLTRAPLSGQLEPQEGLKQEIQAFLSQDPTVQANLSPNQKMAIQQAASQGTPQGQATLRMVNSGQAKDAPVAQLVQEITARQAAAPTPAAAPAPAPGFSKTKASASQLAAAAAATAAPDAPELPDQAASRQAGPVQGKTDGWGIQRTFERDLGGANRAPTRPAGDKRELTNPFARATEPSYAELEQEKYSGRTIVKSSTQMRDVGTQYGLAWRQLNPAEQACWKNMGWTQHIWDTKASGRVPAAMVTRYGSLKPTQRKSVKSLGFEAEDWDNQVESIESGAGNGSSGRR